MNVPDKDAALYASSYEQAPSTHRPSLLKLLRAIDELEDFVEHFKTFWLAWLAPQSNWFDLFCGALIRILNTELIVSGGDSL